jgi:TonB family protein
MAEQAMPVPDPSKTQPSASEVREEVREKSSAKFETNLADLATRFSAHSGGGLSPELSADLALEIVLNEIVEQACLATGATGAAIVLERDGEMVCRASSGSTAPELGSRLDTSTGLSGECFKTKRTQWCDDTMSDRRADAEASERLGVRSVVVMPLLRKDEIIGVIELFSAQPYAFGVRDERTLEVLADRTLNNLDSAARPLELQKPPDVQKPPDLEQPPDPRKPPDVQRPPDPQKTTGMQKSAQAQKPPDAQKPLDVPKDPESAKAAPLYWSIRDQVHPAQNGGAAAECAAVDAATNQAEINQTETNQTGSAGRPKEDRTEKSVIEKPSTGTLRASAGTVAITSGAKPWPDPAPLRGLFYETSAPKIRMGDARLGEDLAAKNRVGKDHVGKDRVQNDQGLRNPARTRGRRGSRPTPDAGGWLLGAAAVACAILLALVAGRHWGARNASLYSHARVNKSSRAAKTSDSANNHDSSTGSALAATNPDATTIPPGGLVVSENGKEVFRAAAKTNHPESDHPKNDDPAAADHAVGVNRASSIESEGVMELSPSAAENDLLQRVEPDYPEAAREQNIQGTVVLQVHIAADGGVQDVQVVSGPPVLAEASTDAVKQWKFKPRMVKGSPVEMQTTITLKFRLPQGKLPQ